MNEILRVIKNRRSIRQFKTEQIKKEDLETILEMAVYAPSAGNRQPWHFTVIQRKELIDELSEAAKEMLKKDGQSPYSRMAENESFHIYYHAPTVIIVSGSLQGGFAQADCAAATQNILLAAEALGLGSCWVNLVMPAFKGEPGEELIKKLGIPEGYRPLYSIALGYKGTTASPAPPRRRDCFNCIA